MCFKEGEVECYDIKLLGAPFILVDNASAKRRRNTHLLAARTPVHEDGGHDHDAPVVTAEKVVIARQKARALTVSSGMLRKRGGNGTSTPTRDTFQNAYLEECQWVGDGPKRDPSENNFQTRSNIEEKQGN